MHLSFIWEKEYSSSLPRAPLSLYFSFITKHVSSLVSLGVPCTSRFYFSALSLSAFPLFSSLSASSTLCCFHCLYEHFLNQTRLIKLADGGAFPARAPPVLCGVDFTPPVRPFLITTATLCLTPLMCANISNNWGLLSKKSHVGK